MASSQEYRETTRKKNLPYHQNIEFDEEEDEYSNEYDRSYSRNAALYNSEYTEDEGEYDEYGEGNYEESEYTENIDPDSPTSPSNGHPFPSPPPSPPTDDGYDDDDISHTANKSTSIIPPPPTRSKRLPSIPQHVPDRSQTVFRPSAPTPTNSKKGKSYFTTLFKFKKPQQHKEEEIRNIGSPLPGPPQNTQNTQNMQNVQITLPSLAPSSPISHQLPPEYLEPEEETDNHSEVQTTPELTMDDLYHLVLNMQKGFQLQVNEMNAQIKELKREIRKLKGEESEEEDEKNLESLRSPSRTATSVRSNAREMERFGGEGRWFHSENS